MKRGGGEYNELHLQGTGRELPVAVQISRWQNSLNYPQTDAQVTFFKLDRFQKCGYISVIRVLHQNCGIFFKKILLKRVNILQNYLYEQWSILP